MAAVVAWRSSVGGSPIMPAFNTPPMRGCSWAAAGHAKARVSTSAIRTCMSRLLSSESLLWSLEDLANGGDDRVGIRRREGFQGRTERNRRVRAVDAHDRRVEIVEALLHDHPRQPEIGRAH